MFRSKQGSTSQARPNVVPIECWASFASTGDWYTAAGIMSRSSLRIYSRSNPHDWKKNPESSHVAFSIVLLECVHGRDRSGGQTAGGAQKPFLGSGSLYLQCQH